MTKNTSKKTPAKPNRQKLIMTAERFIERLKTYRSTKEDLIHKAAGGWLREAGKRDRQRLLSFLDKYAATMSRTMLRYAIERLVKKQRELYLSMK